MTNHIPLKTIIVLLLTCGLLGSGVALAGAGVDDDTVRAAVREELNEDPAVRYADVNVTVIEGIVTLTGKVENILAKERATELARTIKGVRAVINNINVRPPEDRAAAAIKADVDEALLRDPATDRYEIDVVVDEDGTVTLSGTVESWQEKELAAIVTKGVRGVTNVTNKITVDYQRTRSDAGIEAEIKQTLRWDALVDHVLIDVDVDDRRVTLSGTVGSAAEKSQAISDAWVTGVKSVDADQLKVARWARDDDLRTSKYENLADADIRAAIRDALRYDARVDSVDVTVEVEHGTVTLRGVVDNLKAKRAAEENARNTVGVYSVRNCLKVEPVADLSDKEIAELVVEALERDPFVERDDVDIDVANGIAYLYGRVDSYYEKSQADDVASRVAGVKKVRNHLVVDYARGPFVYDPFVYDPYPYDYDWYDYEPEPPFRSDAEIKKEIEDEIWWSPFVDSDDVTVTVEDGVATLAGTVDSWSEYRAAAANAYEGGAIGVENELEVR